MGFHSDKLTFQTDEITNEIRQPQIFLCNRQLNTLGEISPVNNLRIKCSLNGADEISFQTPKNVRNYNDSDLKKLNQASINTISREGNRLYGQLKDYSVILVPGFGYFEVSPSVSDAATKTKNISGSSLGEAELAQLFCTLECNTEIDISKENYVPTILYNANNPDASLIDRILSYAPNYTVGTVDDTIKNIQRTFSFSNKDIISCFSDIAEEINCIFDVVVRKNEDGIVERVVNIYDAQYCSDCGSRNVINGICQDCKSTNITGIGEDTTIQIGTDNLSDEITLTPDGNMKNCFIIEGGDDIITSTVEGIMPSGNNKLYQFSEETRLSFSPGLKAAYEEYEKKYEENKKDYAEALELEYGIFDLILYLQSGRMPTVQTAKRNLRDETIHVICQFQKLFPNGLGTLDPEGTTLKNGTVRQVFSLFVDDGYAVKQVNGAIGKENGNLYWTGDIVIYEIGNNDSKATIHIEKNSSYIEWLDKTTSNGVLSSDSDKSEKTNDLSKWGINFTTDNDKYETYLKQKILIEQKNYEYIEDQESNHPKEWQKYSLNRLYSYYSGYEQCVETLHEAKRESSLPSIQSTANDIITSYHKTMEKISGYMSRLEEMIYHLYFYYDQNFYSPSSPAPSEQDINYAKYNNPENRKHFPDANTAFENMFHYIKWGTWVGGEESESTDAPICCGDCGSNYVTLLNCLNKGCNSTNIVTYSTLADLIKKAYQEDPVSLEVKRKEIRERCDIKSDENLGSKLYSELCSFIREDIYTNSNFISDGLSSNSELITRSKELIQKADHELAKACVSQHTLSGNVYAFVAYSRLDKNDFPIQNAYDKFKLGNFMRYFSDNEEYKLRLSSEEFIWSDSGAELNVEFTDIVRYSDGGISDITSLVQAVGNLSTSFDSVKKQAEQGVEAKNTFETIKNEGLYSSLSHALNARNQDVQIDDKGITLRKYDYDLDDYCQYQMKLINRNIVMTKDNWETADLAIGLGSYGEGNNASLVYGVWADVLVGNILVGEKVIIANDEDPEKSSVLIDGDGIKITSTEDQNNPDDQNDSNVCVVLNPKNDKVLNIFQKDSNGANKNILYIDNKGNAEFNGEIDASGLFSGTVNADSGNIGGFTINADTLYSNIGSYQLDSYSVKPQIELTPNNLNIFGSYQGFSSDVELGTTCGVDGLFYSKDDNKKNHSHFCITSDNWERKNTPIYMQLSYPDSSFLVDGSRVKIDGMDLHSPSNCYLGGNDYNYGKIQEYIEPDTDIASDKIFGGAGTHITKSISLQKLGRIIIFSAVVTFTGLHTNVPVGRIPVGYRPFVNTAISADNYANNSECEINNQGVIIFSCSGAGDYRIHGVWFWDAEKEYTEDSVG